MVGACAPPNLPAHLPGSAIAEARRANDRFETTTAASTGLRLEACLIRREFTVAGEYEFNRTSAVRWVISHLLRYPFMPIFVILANVVEAGLFSYAPVLVGQAFDLMLSPERNAGLLLQFALLVVGVRVLQGSIGLFASGT